MKLVNYKCSICDAEVEELFATGEEIPDELDHPCTQCDGIGTLLRWNFKNNKQIQKFDGQW
jgi:DNA-directed RNA polymerase subunit RPC12/RpoP